MLIKFLENKTVKIDTGFNAVPFAKGQTKDLPDAIAKQLIAAKAAESVRADGKSSKGKK